MESTTELASNFTVGRYQELRTSLEHHTPASWAELLSALRRRVAERFLRPMRDLARFDQEDELPNRPGFAILALDCLLIDTIMAFREGRVGTGTTSPARSFRTFLMSQRFRDFNGTDRKDFFDHVRNAILHNGETRKDWKVRIDTARLMEKNGTTRTINRRLFHAAVIREWRDLYHEIAGGEREARRRFLQRMDSMAGLPVTSYPHVYFAYGSNLLGNECRHTAPNAQDHGRAFLPGYRLAFTKHSITRQGDAATITPDANSMVWGYTYRLTDADKDRVQQREGGYDELQITVYLAEEEGESTRLRAFTYIARTACPKQCGPPKDYLDLIINGATERGLPQEYQDGLARHITVPSR